ncbi:MAG TPA: hypothetical protein VI233_08185 [Puia sp.]
MTAKNPFLLAALCCAALLGACRQNEDSARLSLLTNGLQQANEVVSSDNKLVYKAFESRLADPVTSKYAKKWANKIFYTRDLSIRINNHLDSLISNEKLAKPLSSQERKALFDSLTTYRTALQESKIEDTISLPILQGYSGSAFNNVSPSMTLALLNKIKNDVTIAEGKIINDFFRHIEAPWRHHQFIELLAVLSSSYVKAGQPIEVTAGMASFDLWVQPRITINGILTTANEDSTIANRTIIASSQPGKHSIPVRIEYTKPDGSTGTIDKSLTYEVAPK